MRNDLHLRQDPKADLQQTMQPTATTQTTVRVAGPRDAAAWSERARAEPQRRPVLHPLHRQEAVCLCQSWDLAEPAFSTAHWWSPGPHISMTIFTFMESSAWLVGMQGAVQGHQNQTLTFQIRELFTHVRAHRVLYACKGWRMRVRGSDRTSAITIEIGGLAKPSFPPF